MGLDGSCTCRLYPGTCRAGADTWNQRQPLLTDAARKDGAGRVKKGRCGGDVRDLLNVSPSIVTQEEKMES